jgi:hypothetical protein
VVCNFDFRYFVSPFSFYDKFLLARKTDGQICLPPILAKPSVLKPTEQAEHFPSSTRCTKNYNPGNTLVAAGHLNRFIMTQKTIITALALLFFLTQAGAQEAADKPAKANTEKRFYLNLQSGLGIRLGSIPDNVTGPLRELAEDQRTAILIDAELGYRFDGNQAIGLRYSRFNASGTAPISGQNFTAKETITWIGPVYSYMMPLGSQSASHFVARLGAGLASFKGDYSGNAGAVDFSGSAFSGLAGIGLNIHLANSIGLLLGADYSSGTIKIEGSDERENIGMIRLTGGLQIRF